MQPISTRFGSILIICAASQPSRPCWYVSPLIRQYIASGTDSLRGLEDHACMEMLYRHSEPMCAAQGYPIGSDEEPEESPAPELAAEAGAKSAVPDDSEIRDDLSAGPPRIAAAGRASVSSHKADLAASETQQQQDMPATQQQQQQQQPAAAAEEAETEATAEAAAGPPQGTNALSGPLNGMATSRFAQDDLPLPSEEAGGHGAERSELGNEPNVRADADTTPSQLPRTSADAGQNEASTAEVVAEPCVNNSPSPSNLQRPSDEPSEEASAEACSPREAELIELLKVMFAFCRAGGTSGKMKLAREEGAPLVEGWLHRMSPSAVHDVHSKFGFDKWDQLADLTAAQQVRGHEALTETAQGVLNELVADLRDCRRCGRHTLKGINRYNTSSIRCIDCFRDERKLRTQAAKAAASNPPETGDLLGNASKAGMTSGAGPPSATLPTTEASHADVGVEGNLEGPDGNPPEGLALQGQPSSEVVEPQAPSKAQVKPHPGVTHQPGVVSNGESSPLGVAGQRHVAHMGPGIEDVLESLPRINAPNPAGVAAEEIAEDASPASPKRKHPHAAGASLQLPAGAAGEPPNDSSALQKPEHPNAVSSAPALPPASMHAGPAEAAQEADTEAAAEAGVDAAEGSERDDESNDSGSASEDPDKLPEGTLPGDIVVGKDGVRYKIDFDLPSYGRIPFSQRRGYPRPPSHMSVAERMRLWPQYIKRIPVNSQGKTASEAESSASDSAPASDHEADTPEDDASSDPDAAGVDDPPPKVGNVVREAGDGRRPPRRRQTARKSHPCYYEPKLIPLASDAEQEASENTDDDNTPGVNSCGGSQGAQPSVPDAAEPDLEPGLKPDTPEDDAASDPDAEDDDDLRPEGQDMYGGRLQPRRRQTARKSYPCYYEPKLIPQASAAEQEALKDIDDDGTADVNSCGDSQGAQPSVPDAGEPDLEPGLKPDTPEDDAASNPHAEDDDDLRPEGRDIYGRWPRQRRRQTARKSYRCYYEPKLIPLASDAEQEASENTDDDNTPGVNSSQGAQPSAPDSAEPELMLDSLADAAIMPTQADEALTASPCRGTGESSPANEHISHDTADAADFGESPGIQILQDRVASFAGSGEDDHAEQQKASAVSASASHDEAAVATGQEAVSLPIAKSTLALSERRLLGDLTSIGADQIAETDQQEPRAAASSTLHDKLPGMGPREAISLLVGTLDPMETPETQPSALESGSRGLQSAGHAGQNRPQDMEVDGELLVSPMAKQSTTQADMPNGLDAADDAGRQTPSGQPPALNSADLPADPAHPALPPSKKHSEEFQLQQGSEQERGRDEPVSDQDGLGASAKQQTSGNAEQPRAMPALPLLEDCTGNGDSVEQLHPGAADEFIPAEAGSGQESASMQQAHALQTAEPVNAHGEGMARQAAGAAGLGQDSADLQKAHALEATQPVNAGGDDMARAEAADRAAGAAELVAFESASISMEKVPGKPPTGGMNANSSMSQLAQDGLDGKIPQGPVRDPSAASAAAQPSDGTSSATPDIPTASLRDATDQPMQAVPGNVVSGAPDDHVAATVALAAGAAASLPDGAARLQQSALQRLVSCILNFCRLMG